MALTLAVIVLLTVADRALKIFIPPILENGSVVLIPKLIGLNYHQNRALVFGLGYNSNCRDLIMIIVIAMTIIFVAALLYLLFFSRINNVWFRLSLILIISGGIGNLIDRIFYGYVVDFIEFLFVDFAIFNLADCFICIGAALMVVYMLFFDKQEVKEKESNEETADAE